MTRIDPCIPDAGCESLRLQVREFLAETLRGYPALARARQWSAADPAFSRRLGERGWIGMTWPRRYGGHERSQLERYVVLEELLAAGAPVAAHWTADRQSGPMLIRCAPDTLAPKIVPGIARGEVYFCIGLSESDTGSDLASVRTRATRIDGGWVLEGAKLWTTGAHRAHYMIALARTGPQGESRHAGLSQFLVDLDTPGVTVRPIRNQAGEHDFNEVAFDGVEVPDECLVGSPGEGWAQVSAELGFERSGPERYLSGMQLMLEMIDSASAQDARARVALGRLVAHYATLRQMSLGVAGLLARGEEPGLSAAIVKDLGATLEQSLPDVAHDLFGRSMPAGSALAEVADYITRAAPSFSLRGGTREILRNIVARGLGLR
ncbi:MAG: acyl-CoA dehydrogenase [Burkholderiales bacterium]|nr:MAG: acyl-CoA dehydrogenase [Burkholderiales bacterium]